MSANARLTRRAALQLGALAGGGALAGCGGGVAFEGGEAFTQAVEPAPWGARMRDGALGRDGSYGVGVTQLQVAARGGDGFSAEVTAPLTQTGALAWELAPLPVVLFVHGGLVARRRYRWLTRHLSTRGYVTVAPSHALDLAIFESDNAALALRAARALLARHHASGADAGADAGDAGPRRSVLGPVAAVGHSLGGVIATRAWLAERYEALALLASYPEDGAPVRSRAGTPVLGLVGANDRKAPRERYRAGLDSFAEPRRFSVLADLNHYDFCEDNTAAELATDGPPSRNAALARQRIAQLLDLFLDGVLRESEFSLRQLDGLLDPVGPA